MRKALWARGRGKLEAASVVVVTVGSDSADGHRDANWGGSVVYCLVPVFQALPNTSTGARWRGAADNTSSSQHLVPSPPNTSCVLAFPAASGNGTAGNHITESRPHPCFFSA